MTDSTLETDMVRLSVDDVQSVLALKDAGMTVPDPEELRLMEAVIEAGNVVGSELSIPRDWCAGQAWRAARAALTAYRERGK